jgi:hypothetical protein
VGFDFMAGHLLVADRFARRIVAGPYIDDDADETPSKEPTRGGPFNPDSFNDDQAPPKMPPTKQTPPGIRRPDVPMLMAPQSLQVQRQPLMPGELPAELLPGENGRPAAPPMGMPPPRMPGIELLQASTDCLSVPAGEVFLERWLVRRDRRRHI